MFIENDEWRHKSHAQTTREQQAELRTRPYSCRAAAAVVAQPEADRAEKKRAAQDVSPFPCVVNIYILSSPWFPHAIFFPAMLSGVVPRSRLARRYVYYLLLAAIADKVPLSIASVE